MSTTTYKIMLEGDSGAAYAMFQDGALKMFINEWSKFTEPPKYIPIQEKSFIAWSNDYKVTALQPRSVADKVALFCLLYKQHKNLTYRAGKEEKANLKLVTVNNELLEVYFTSTQYPLTGTKSMADYVRHYNTVRDLATNGKPVKSAFPDVYDREYEKRIGEDVSKLQRYWAHLRAQGWVKNDGVWIHKSNQ